MELLSGNEAIARGAYEAGVTVACGYPGTPSTEILETVAKLYKNEIYCEWSPNEKVAFEVSAAAAMAGARSIVTMKHVGLNVAADPLMTLAYVGVKGGMVICVADDPGMHSSQNEQDSRNYAKFAKLPLLEPSDSQEAKDFLIQGIHLSEKYGTPVILRTLTRISHSRTLVSQGERVGACPVRFEKNPSQFVMVPLWAKERRLALEQRLRALREESVQSQLNRVEMADLSLGIITNSIAYQYVKEVWPNASILKLGFSYPFPDDLIRNFAKKVGRILIVEELDDLIEEHVKALGIVCDGKNYIPNISEFSVSVLEKSRSLMDGTPLKQTPFQNSAVQLPPRPPVLCAGCPHRGIFHLLKKHDVVVMGDIGCYSLAAFKPLERLDTILCMGGGISMAQGIDKAKNDRKVVGIMGDSTFFHSGITGLLDIAYNKGTSTIIVVDNRITAMTGQQENPGTGRTLMGEKTIEASIADIGRACGIRRVFEVDPYDLDATQKILTQEINMPEPSLIVSKAPCVLLEKKLVGTQKKIDHDKCRHCQLCLKIGCPAIESSGDKPQINSFLCVGCSLCQQVCPFGAIGNLRTQDE